MQVCDITRSEDVAGTVTILIDTNDDNTDAERVQLDVGKQALDAFRTQDWQALHGLTPHSLRKKDPKRSEAAKKAGQTRAANRAEKGSQTAPAGPSEPSSGNGGKGSPTPADDF